MDAVPKRKRGFANRFIGMLATTNVANQIGPEAAWLLSVVAIHEEIGRYRKPAEIYHTDLMQECGFASLKKLDRIRTLAINAGWLRYESFAGYSGKYLVLIPDAFMDDFSGPREVR